MRRFLALFGLGLMLTLSGCGPLIAYGLCKSEMLDCSNGRDGNQEVKK
jgi:hypothetical protein